MNFDKVVLASGNPGKTKEIQEILKGSGPPPSWTLVSAGDLLDDLGFLKTVETFETYRENAQAKARAVAKKTGLPAIADDSGLEVDALSGVPGVHTAHYATPSKGQEQNDANMEKLLSALKGQDNRSARFVATLVLVDPTSGKEWLAEGELKGAISSERRGNLGFGYDPVFVPEGESQTLGELGEAVKNQYSHRARGMLALLKLLRS